MQNPLAAASLRLGMVAPSIIVLILLLAFSYEFASELLRSADPAAAIILTVKQVYWAFYQRILTDPYFYIAIPVIFLIQLAIPVDRNQPQFGTATRVDALYTCGMMVVYGALAPPFLNFLHFIYSSLFGWISTDFFTAGPTWAQFLLGYLLIDLVGWLHHLVRHKVPAFWEFHAIHHSQRELNPFSNERVHPFDWIVANTIRFLPAFFFTDALQIVLGYWAAAKALDHFNHGNIRTNLGWLKYIFVTPQSHRVHHSPLPRHRDTNFGVSLSIWDHLFGTQYRNYDEYPGTGIEDPTFPLEHDVGLKGLTKLLSQQFLYPFVRIWRTLPKRNTA